jgi:large subunit ribosomal protein L25
MNYVLAAAQRTAKGEKVRAGDVIPAVVYGAEKGAQSLSLGGRDFLKLYKKAGESSLIDLSIDGKESGKVLIQEVQFDPVSDKVMHVDLRRIDMTKAMTAPVTLRFVGEAPIVKASGGTLMTAISVVTVKCLPNDLVSHIDVDLSGLKTYEDTIKLKDIKLPAGIEITNPHAEDLIAKAMQALTEEEIKAMEEASAGADISKIELAGKKKEEEGEEGAAPAEGAPAAGADVKKPEAKKEEKKEEKKK